MTVHSENNSAGILNKAHSGSFGEKISEIRANLAKGTTK